MKHSFPLVIKSFAKLNLYLQILNKRKDNFHNLNTLFCRIDLADTLIFKKRNDAQIKIRCNNPDVPCDGTNLCWRAAELLKQELKLDFGIDIEIRKRIPVGAGLGGGSSNAAAVLLGLNRYWNLNLPKERLAKIGAKIGSDVPFFICDTKFALGSRRGDKIKPLSSLGKLKLWFILIYPNIKVSTPRIYQEFDTFDSPRFPRGSLSINPERNPELAEGRSRRIDAFSGLTPHLVSYSAFYHPEFAQGAGLTRKRCNVKILTSELLQKGEGINPRCLINDLEIITASLYPVVNQAKKALSGMGLEKIMMSGSGPAVFALCNGRKQAQDLSRELAKAHKSWQIFVTSTV